MITQLVHTFRLNYPTFKWPKFRLLERLERLLRRSEIRNNLAEAKRLEEIIKPLAHGRTDALTGEPNFHAGEQGSFAFKHRVAFQAEIDRLQKRAASDIKDINRRINRLPHQPTIDEKAVLGSTDERNESILRRDSPSRNVHCHKANNDK